MRGFIVVLLTYLVLGTESPLLHRLEVSLYAPNLALVAVMFTSVVEPGLAGVVASFAIGLLHDGFSMGAPIGLHTEIAVLSFLLMRLGVRKLAVAGAVPLMLATFAMSLLSSLLFFLLSAVFDRSFDAFSMVFSVMIPNALVTAPFAPLLFPLYGWVLDRITRRRTKELYVS
jgi:rod shape-determining protein MreD